MRRVGIRRRRGRRGRGRAVKREEMIRMIEEDW
jgi:hypothetical protein